MVMQTFGFGFAACIGLGFVILCIVGYGYVWGPCISGFAVGRSREVLDGRSEVLRDFDFAG